MSDHPHGYHADVGDLVQLIRPSDPESNYGFGLVVDVQQDGNRWLHVLGQRYRVRATHTKIISRVKGSKD